VIGPAIYALAATRDADGNAVIAYAGLDHTLYTQLVLPGQQPAGQQPTVLAGSSSAPTIYRGALALTSYTSGGLALFYIGDSGKIYHYYQVVPGASWAQQSLASTASCVTAARMVDDTMALFFADLNGTLYYSWPQAQQDGSSQWSAPVLLGGTANKGNSLTAALNAAGRLELFYIDDQNLYHNWQMRNWQTLQNVSLSAIRSQSYPIALTVTDSHEVSFGYPHPPQLGAVLWLKAHYLSFNDGSSILMYIEWLVGQAGEGSMSQITGFTHDLIPNGFSVEATAFAFRENERLSSFTLYQKDSAVVGLQFETSLGESFTAGNPNYFSSSTAVQLSGVAGAVLMGFYGIQQLKLQDANVDLTNPPQTIPRIVGLGLWISNSVKSISVQNIRYDLGRATITNQQAQSLNSIELVNDTDDSQMITENTSYTLASSSNWSHSAALSIGGSVSLNVGYVPAYETGGVTFGLTVTANTQYTLTDTTGGDVSQSTNYSYTASATVSPHSKLRVSIACTRATLSVPYVADVVVTYTNDTRARLNTSPGVYSGVQNYDIRATYNPSG
jgi:hypothetical protein